MKKIDLTSVSIFRNIGEEKIDRLLDRCAAPKRIFAYEKNRIIFGAGQTTRKFGIVVAGSVNIEAVNYDGQKTIFGHVAAGDIFAETYAFADTEPLPVDVVAAEKGTEIVFLDAKRIVSAATCNFGAADTQTQKTLLENLLHMFAQKNLHLSGRMMHTTPRTIRQRLLIFLESYSKKTGTAEFEIPFNRQQLADYLNVDRSALSHELGSLQKEGLLRTKKNWFELL